MTLDWDSWKRENGMSGGSLSSTKKKIVEEQIEFFASPKGVKAVLLGRSFFSAVSEELDEVIQAYIVEGQPHPEYDRSEVYDEENNCILIKHGLLDEYIGKYYSEIPAAKEFLNPNLEIESATFVRYLGNDSKYSPEGDPEYVVEHVYKGEMHVLYDNTPDYMRLGMYRPLLAHGYRPKVDPPKDKLVYKNLEVLVFTYREKQ